MSFVWVMCVFFGGMVCGAIFKEMNEEQSGDMSR